MTIVQKIWGKIGLIWFAIGFIGFMVLIFPLHYIFLKRGKTNLSHRLNVLWGKFIFLWGFTRVRVHGKEHLRAGQVYVITPNHKSYLDIPTCHFLPINQFRFIGKAELNDLPLFGWMFQRLHVPVKRGQASAAARSFILSERVLRSGISMVIYPEGGIIEGYDLAPFKDGPFQLAMKLKLPILPVYIQNTSQIMPDKSSLYYFLFQTIHLYILEPIDTQGLTENDLPILKQKVWDLLHERMQNKK